MRDVCLALAQTAPKLGDIEANLEQHREAVARARAEGVDLVVFPELSLTGYLLRDQVPEVALAEGAAPLEELARLSRDVDLVVGYVEDAPGHRFHNVAAYLSAGRVVHRHRKIYLPTYGLFQEGRDFSPGQKIRAFESPFGQSGMLVCEDLWHATCPWLLAQQGAQVIYVLSNGPTRGTREGAGITSLAVWQDLTQVTAQFQTAFIVYVNRAGCEDGLTYGGGSHVVDPFGRVVVECAPLDPDWQTVTMEAEVLRRARTAYPLLRDENLDLTARELQRLRSRRYDVDEADLSGDAPR